MEAKLIMENGEVVAITEDGRKFKLDALVAFDNEENGKSYIIYTDNSKDEYGNVRISASIVKDPSDPNSELEEITSEKDWKIVSAILDSTMNTIKKNPDVDMDELAELSTQQVRELLSESEEDLPSLIMENGEVVHITEDGEKIQIDTLVTFDDDTSGKSYIIYTDNSTDEDGNVRISASIVKDPNDPNSALEPIGTGKEWETVSTVMETLLETMEENPDLSKEEFLKIVEKRLKEKLKRDEDE